PHTSKKGGPRDGRGPRSRNPWRVGGPLPTSPGEVPAMAVTPPGAGAPGHPVPDPDAATDASLLRRYRRGEDDAATELYVRYAERLRALAAAQASPDLQRRIDPDD